MNDLRQKIKEAINTTLVVQNKQSIDICVDKIARYYEPCHYCFTCYQIPKEKYEVLEEDFEIFIQAWYDSDNNDSAVLAESLVRFIENKKKL